ncbi:uncharacterized protein TNCV_169231 [Trichonephila clavipes]|nr:uncharacterized protein TNCV_169231 [Trichonephila clavipes]
MTVGSIKGKEEVEEQNRFPIPNPGLQSLADGGAYLGRPSVVWGGPLSTSHPDPCLKAFPFPTRVGVMDRSNPPPAPAFSSR